MGYRIRDKSRVATDSIRGYLYQLLHTIKVWLELDEQRLLVAEGNEDIDELVLSGKVVISSKEIQIKQRSGVVWSGSDSIREKILHSLEAFAEYQSQGVAYQGVLITNAQIRGKDTQIRKWIRGEQLNFRMLESELRAMAKRAGKKYVIAFRSMRPHLTAFVKSISWITQAGDESQIIESLTNLVLKRAPQVQPDVAINALVRHMCRAMTMPAWQERRLRAIDADIVLNNSILSALAGAEATRTGWTTAVWSQVATDPYTAVSVALFVLDEARYRRSFRELEGKAALTNRSVTREQLLEEFVCGDFHFVAYASLRRKKGPRGVRVCLRDVVRQSKHRHTPDRLLIQHGAPLWLDKWLQHKWVAPICVMEHSQDYLWLEFARIIGDLVARGPEQAMHTLGTKLRWVHEVETEKYFTADRPTG